MRGKSVPREVSPRTIATVLRMRRTSTLSNREIAKQLGIGRSTVDRIVRGLHVSFRENRYQGVRRCVCGASIVGRCVQCEAVAFLQEVDHVMNRFAKVQGALQACGVDDELPIDADLRRLIVAAAESKAVSAWLLAIRDGELIPSRLAQMPDEVAADLGKRDVPISKLSRIVPAAIEAADLVSQETSDDCN